MRSGTSLRHSFATMVLIVFAGAPSVDAQVDDARRQSRLHGCRTRYFAVVELANLFGQSVLGRAAAVPGGSYLSCSNPPVASGTACELECANGYTKTGTDPTCYLGNYAGATNACVATP